MCSVRDGDGFPPPPPRLADECNKDMKGRGNVNIWLLQDIATEKRDTEYNIQNDIDRKNKWNYNRKSK